ncbi:hypothetical protein AA18890_2445 [Komagataeibacter europaeus LMG 18890]|nr:hypothetical protein AA18890_2445 [Komagataeibacter europaeus LMG 18890]
MVNTAIVANAAAKAVATGTVALVVRATAAATARMAAGANMVAVVVVKARMVAGASTAAVAVVTATVAGTRTVVPTDPPATRKARQYAGPFFVIDGRTDIVPVTRNG